MRHSYEVRGPAFRLRPVERVDAAFILGLRTDPRRGRYLNPTSGRLEDQVRYVEAYFDRPGDYYFIVERHGGEREGAIALYDHDEAARCAEWGRWILREGSLAAVESALLVYTFAFETLELARVYCRTVAANKPVVSFHTSCGLEATRTLGAHATLRGEAHDAIEQELRADRWPAVRERLTGISTRLGEALIRPETVARGS